MDGQNFLIEKQILSEVIQRLDYERVPISNKKSDENKKNQILNDEKLAKINQKLINYKSKSYEIDLEIIKKTKNFHHEEKSKTLKENVNILQSLGDGSCLLHSINQLLFINGYEKKDQQNWRIILSLYIDDYILSNLSQNNLNNEKTILLNSLIEEKKFLEHSTGWLSNITISIFCTIFNFNIRIINLTNNSEYIDKGLLNNNSINLNLYGGLAFNGNHWDCFVN
jgi:hypothetical protein